MARVPCELALTRVLDYLGRCGVQPTREVMQRALRLVEDGLAPQEDAACTPNDEGRDAGERVLAEAEVAALIAQTMARLPQHFVLPAPILPEAWPPLQRGSIGYESR